MRRSGIEVVGEVPWGTHFCQFYETAQDLIEMLVPYFHEGLAADEFCMWVTSEPVQVEQAAASLRAQVPDLDDYARKGQIEILDYSQWYTRSGRFSAAEVLQGWVDKLTAARQRGYEGLRLTGNTLWLEPGHWDDFTQYEEMVNNVIGQYPMLALCTYSLRKCGATEIMDVLSNHQFALVKRAGRWEIIESARHKQTENALRESEERLRRAQEIAHLGSWELDLVHDRLTWSDEVYRLFGLEPQEFATTYEAFLERVHPDDRAAVDAAYSASLREGIDGYEIEHRVIRKGTGETRVVHEKCEHVRDASGKIIRSVGMVLDITERKRAEEALRQSRDELERRVEERTAELAESVSVLRDEVQQRIKAEEAVKAERQRLFAVLNRLPGYVVLKDPGHQIRFASHGYLEVFGEPGGRPCYEVEYGLDHPCDGCRMPEVLDDGRPHDWERIYPNGQTYHVWSFPFTDTDGTPLMMQLGLDVTERKRLELMAVGASEAERRRIGRDLHDTLGQSLTGLGYLVGGLSNKLADTSPEGRAMANQVIDTVKEAVGQVRALARGLDPIGLQADGLVAALGELADTVQSATGIRCRLEYDKPVVLEPSVAMHLYHITQEALNNATKHARAKRIVVSLTADIDCLTLRIQDDGVGMTDRARDGTGMGLRIMEYRAGIIGASLVVRAGDNGGTIVTCALSSNVPGSGSRGAL